LYHISTRNRYRHDEPFLVLGAGRLLNAATGLPTSLPNGEPDPGLVVADPLPHRYAGRRGLYGSGSALDAYQL
jgi:hypothetical protein